MLDYTLIENLLTPAPDDYMAQTANVRSYTNDEIADRIMKTGAGLTRSDILSVLQAQNEVICDIIAEGDAVNTPLFNTQPSISGVFDSASDSFDSSRHRVKINLSAGKALRDAVTKVRTKKVQVADAAPIITEVKDMVTGSVNDQLTKNTVVQITGGRLKFLSEEADNGVFLVNADNAVFRRMEVVLENKPARLMVMIPQNMQVGTYYLEVRTTFSNSVKPTKTLKVSRFNKILTIV